MSFSGFRSSYRCKRNLTLRFLARFSDRKLYPNCQATSHYPRALALVSGIPTFKDNYHSSESPPLYLPLSAAPCVIRCSHPCADKDISLVQADRCTVTLGRLAGWESRSQLPSFPPSTSMFSFPSLLTRANGGLLWQRQKSPLFTSAVFSAQIPQLAWVKSFT